MPVFKPRNRLVNFRLSEEEFERLRASCFLNGARSLSDFARVAVMRSVTAASDEVEGEATDASKLSTMDEKVHQLEARIAELGNLMQALRAGVAQPAAEANKTPMERS